MTAIRALIFDFNGVILNDEPIHNRNLQQVFMEDGVDLPMSEIQAKCHGRGDNECFVLLLQEAGKEPAPDRVESLVARKSRKYKETILRDLPFVPGVEDFLASWKGRLPLALATGALPGEVEFVIENTRLGEYFDVMTTTVEAGASKPDPAVYRLTLDRLRKKCCPDLEPVECLVFEDSAVGMQAALDAGMRCVGIATSGGYEELAGGDLVVDDFRSPQLHELLESPV